MSQTIAKNRRAYINSLFERGQDFECHDLASYFVAVPVPREWVQKQLFAFSFARLTDEGGGKYHVRVHGNEWYVFRVPS